MKTRTRALASTASFLLFAAGALAFAWFGIARKDEAAQAKKAADERLYAFAPARVKAVTVEAKGETTRLARAAGGWRVESPVQADAERAAVDALVEKVAGLRRKAPIAAAPDPAALARYGLSQPRAKATFTLDDGKVETLALGDENAFDGTAFVRTTGGAVELVAGDVKWSLERGTFDLREKRLLPFEDKDLQRVEVTAPGLSYALVRDGDGWRLDAPSKERADEATAARVLGAIRGLRATAYLDGPSTPRPGATLRTGPSTPRPGATLRTGPQDDRALGLDRPRWKVKLVPVSGAPRTLLLGEAPTPRGAPAGARSLRAKLEGAREVAILPEGAAKDLDQDLFALRDKAVLHFDRDKVAAARFTAGGATFQTPKESSRLASVLWTLSSLQAKAFADESGRTLAEHGLDHPAREVALLGADGKELDRLFVSPVHGGKTFARAASSPRIVEIDPAALAPLPATAEDLKEKPGDEPAARAQAARK